MILKVQRTVLIKSNFTSYFAARNPCVILISQALPFDFIMKRLLQFLHSNNVLDLQTYSINSKFFIYLFWSSSVNLRVCLAEISRSSLHSGVEQRVSDAYQLPLVEENLLYPPKINNMPKQPVFKDKMHISSYDY